MHSPIILTAFGTTSAARDTYSHIEQAVRKHFPEHDLHWGYSSRVVARELQKSQDTTIRHPVDILTDLATAGQTKAIVQSLHLLPGHEFHSLHQEVRRARGITCQIGMPLLTSPEDYTTLLKLLAPHIEQDRDRAVLVIGHGTRHPVWPAYLALENMLQRQFGNHVFVGVAEHYPDTGGIEEKIVAAGFKEVLMIPFFLVAGMHYRRDMIGDNEFSWQHRLEKRGLVVEAVEDGIGLLPGIGNLVAAHIEEALNAIRIKS